MRIEDVTHGMRIDLKIIFDKVNEMVDDYEMKYGIRPKIILAAFDGPGFDPAKDYQDVRIDLEDDQIVSCL